MANQNYVFGAQVGGVVQASGYSGALRAVAFVSTDGVAAFKGDFVKVTGESTTINGVSYPVVAQAAATNIISGIISDFEPDPTDLTLLYRKASTVRLAYMLEDPYVRFKIQMNGVPAAGDVYTTMDIVVAAGNTTTGLSGMQLNRSASGSTKQIRVLDLYPALSNSWGAYAKVVGVINLHTLKNTDGV